MFKFIMIVSTLIVFQGCSKSTESEQPVGGVHSSNTSNASSPAPEATPSSSQASQSSMPAVSSSSVANPNSSSNNTSSQSATFLLTVEAGSGGSVLINGNTRCDTSCRYTVKNGQALAFTATPNQGFAFDAWLQDCSGTNQATCTLNASGEMSIAVGFVNTGSTPSTLKVESFSLIDVRTNQPISGYDPIIDGAIINSNALGTDAVNLRANASNDTQSVMFKHNGEIIRTENVAPYAIASDNSAGQYNTWQLGYGAHTVEATAYSVDGGQGQAGATSTVTFQWAAIRIFADTASLNFDAIIGNNATTDRQFTVTNSGNATGDFNIEKIPSWVSVNPQKGRLEPGASQIVSVVAQACQSVVQRDDALTLSSDGASLGTVALLQFCLDDTGSNYDLVLNRTYFMQSTTQQDSNKPSDQKVPLVANRSALIRAFVTANRDERQPLPEATFNYRLPDGNTGVINFQTPSQISTTIDETALGETFNAQLPANIMQPGLEYFISIDSANAINELNERNNRFPISGYAALDVRDVPRFDITLVPIAINGSIPELTQEIAEQLLSESLALHPINEYRIRIREPYTSSVSGWQNVLRDIGNLRRSDGSNDYYHGIVNRSLDGSNTAGIGYVSGKSAISRPVGSTIAHELGHNFGRPHAPCGGVSSYDGSYPYAEARIGALGYDQRNGQLKSARNYDYMSYCNPSWTSDYNFNKVLFALINNTIGNFKTQYVPSGQLWSVQGVLDKEIISITDFWKVEDKSLKAEPGYYWIKLLDSNDALLGQGSFNMLNVDHGDEQHFYAQVINELPSVEVNKIQLGIGAEVLFTKDLTPSLQAISPLDPNLASHPLNSRVQKAQQSISVIRLDDQRVSIQWPADGSQLAVYSKAGTLLARDKTGDIIVFTKNNNITLKWYSDKGTIEKDYLVNDIVK